MTRRGCGLPGPNGRREQEGNQHENEKEFFHDYDAWRLRSLGRSAFCPFFSFREIERGSVSGAC
jgi:hypothetical protein